MCTVKFRQLHEDLLQCIVWCCNLHKPKQRIESLMNIHISSAPHSPRRQKLNLRMKSLSLDSPESTEHAQRRKHHGAAATSDPHSNQSSSSRIQCRQNARKIYFRCCALLCCPNIFYFEYNMFACVFLCSHCSWCRSLCAPRRCQSEIEYAFSTFCFSLFLKSMRTLYVYILFSFRVLWRFLL